MFFLYLGYFLLFFLSIYLLFYLPGKILLGTTIKKLSFLEEVTFSICSGIGIFLLGSYCLSFLHLSFLLFVLPLSALIYAVYKRSFFPGTYSLPSWKTILPMIVMIFIFSLPMITSGVFGDTLYLKGVNSNDGIWHLSLIHELQHHFPPDIPGYAGVKLTGYHFFYNFLLAQIRNLTFLPPTFLLFQAFPLLTALLLASNIYIFLTRLTKKESTGILGVFLAFFGGSAAYLAPLFHIPPLNLITGFGVDQPASTLINPPYAFSLLFLMFSLNCIYLYETTKQKQWLILAGIIGGITMMTKVYAGIILLGGWGVYASLSLLKKHVAPLYTTLGIILLTAITYLPFSDPSNHLIYSPLWMLSKMYQENMSWYGYSEKISTYTHLGVIKGIFITNLQGVSVFFLGNLGTRVIGLILFIPLLFQKKSREILSPPTLVLCSFLGVSILLPTFFLQTGQVYEMIQFYWYSLFFFALFAAVGISTVLSRISFPIKSIFLTAFLILTLPSAVSFLLPFFNPTQGRYQSDLFRAEQFLSRVDTYDDVVLELPPLDTSDLKAWYLGNQPTFSSLARHRSYLSFVNHTFTGTDVDRRLRIIKTLQAFMKDGSNEESIIQFLRSFPIRYIVSKERNSNLQKISKKELFHNNTITIYQIK